MHFDSIGIDYAFYAVIVKLNRLISVLVRIITKTRLFKYIEHFISKN